MYRVLVLFAIGCGHATLVTRSPGGGVIELSDSGRAREEADQLMADQCGVDNFTIASDADEPSGRRIHFVCGNVLPADAGP